MQRIGAHVINLFHTVIGWGKEEETFCSEQFKGLN